MNTNNDNPKSLDNRPEWQKISGIDPQREKEMGADARDAAIRKLLDEVTKRAGVEFERADAGKIPEGERSIFWDPLQRICLQLGISRTKLSSYSRELTGLRAHEISDRIVAKRKLMERMRERVEKLLQPNLEFLRESFINHPGFRGGLIEDEKKSRVHWMKSLRKFEKSAGFAAEMGFANFSRLNRACLLAFSKSLDQIEAELVCTLVQKFFEQFKNDENLTQSRKGAKAQRNSRRGSIIRGRRSSRRRPKRFSATRLRRPWA